MSSLNLTLSPPKNIEYSLTQQGLIPSIFAVPGLTREDGLIRKNKVRFPGLPGVLFWHPSPNVRERLVFANVYLQFDLSLLVSMNIYYLKHYFVSVISLLCVGLRVPNFVRFVSGLRISASVRTCLM